MRSLGATDCIPKPFEWEDLIAKIEELAAPVKRVAPSGAPRI